MESPQSLLGIRSHAQEDANTHFNRNRGTDHYRALVELGLRKGDMIDPSVLNRAGEATALLEMNH